MKITGIYKSIYGFIKIIEENGAIVYLKIEEDELVEKEGSPLTKLSYMQVEEYFKGIRKSFDLPIKLNGTSFQLKVWSELLKIPYGEVITYKELAERIGKPKAFRAVGNANNKNPITIIVPCHRVVRSDGQIGGYSSGGTFVKEKLLEIENANSL